MSSGQSRFWWGLFFVLMLPFCMLQGMIAAQSVWGALVGLLIAVAAFMLGVFWARRFPDSGNDSSDEK